MTYGIVGFNNCYLTGLGIGSCFGTFSPVFSYSYYNPFCSFNIFPALFSTSWMMPSFPPVFSCYNYNSYNNYNNNYQFPPITVPNSFSTNFDSLNSNWNLYSFNDYSKTDCSTLFGAITARANNSFNDLKSASSTSLTSSTYSTSLASSASSKSSISSVYPSAKPIYSTFSKDYLNKEFLNKVKQVAKNINCDYEDLLALMNSESSLNPTATYKKPNGEKTAVGLIQFTKSDAIPELNRVYGLNLTLEKIEKMSALEQLDLVEKYYKMNANRLPKGKKLTAADLYAVTFLPARAKREVLTRSGEKYYNSNRGLDVNGDGVITKSDLNERLAQKRVNLDTFV